MDKILSELPKLEDSIPTTPTQPSTTSPTSQITKSELDLNESAILARLKNKKKSEDTPPTEEENKEINDKECPPKSESLINLYLLSLLI
ncbi:MAG: hypothetical protein KatS3mg002_1402 [Candidatus Woesearchaeota archaeon]|nr:MAG: hypothetical protein KatS3mg002_1402 [Candidatus Woesearchaeota archaeon]